MTALRPSPHGTIPLAELLLEGAPDALVGVDSGGLIRVVNRQTELLFGYDRHELTGRPIELLVPVSRPGNDRTHWRAYLENPGARTMGTDLELMGRRRDGTEFPVQINLACIDTSDGPLITAAVRDMTARDSTPPANGRPAGDITPPIMAEDGPAERIRQLERDNAELAQFAYLAAHDLQEPLRKVASFCRLLARRYEGRLDEQADLYIAYAVDGATRMQQLVNDLLMFCRMGEQHGEPVEVDCNVIVDRVRHDLGVAIEESGGEVLVTGRLPTVRGEETRLAQLFENLIGNAVKFRGADPPHVEVSAVRNGAEWRFAVADNGIGIEPQYTDRIFAIFQRLHTRAEYPGTGIGLAVCKRVVEAYGGRIWFESRPGMGTTFYWTMPLDPAEA